MAMKGTEIIKLDAKKLIGLLNKAYADEWFAYYQYWVGAKVVRGVIREAAAAELTQHAADELKHAGMLADRIIQLGGTPATDITQFGKLANCSYLNPKNPAVKAILQQGVDGERCAIGVYYDLLEMVRDKDVITYDMILSILKDELEHEADFLALLDDLK